MDFGGSRCQSVHSGVCKKCVIVHVRTLAAHVSLCIVVCVYDVRNSTCADFGVVSLCIVVCVYEVRNSICADFGGSRCQSVHSGVCKTCVIVHVRTL